MGPTRVRLLVLLAVVAAAVGWSLVELMQGQSGRVLPVPWLAAVTMWVFALGLLAWTVVARPRLLRRPGHRRLDPIVAARTAALAMAASRTGALVLGAYAGIGLGALSARQTPAGQQSLLASLATVVGALAVIVIALWLERLCRLPADDDESGERSGGNGKANGKTGGRQVHPEPGLGRTAAGNPRA